MRGFFSIFILPFFFCWIPLAGGYGIYWLNGTDGEEPGKGMIMLAFLAWAALQYPTWLAYWKMSEFMDPETGPGIPLEPVISFVGTTIVYIVLAFAFA